MGEKWHGGKGDKSRISDSKKYHEGMERIYGRKSWKFWVVWEGYDLVVIGTRLAQEDGFNLLQETGEYINFDGTVLVKIQLYEETGFNLLQENGYQLLVDRY